ncbi:DUF6474 family protein [Amycolatopsis sp. CA-230715]|uniref:DUF6474 family protein n=1 Tax=Amycolatopsis sp. CA-230715 TaxID=2745196 RepID=UPI0020B433F1|nr:DUF6474 family protein [Amycolatopsis sp. CA-230715]
MADSKAAKKAAKAAGKDEKKAVKQAKKDAIKAVKKAHKKGETGSDLVVTAEREDSRFTPKKARNAIAVAKVVGPAVIPVIAPFAVRAAGAAREAYDRYQARKLGIGVDQLGEYSGRGAGLHARIAGLSEGFIDLHESGKASDEDRKFAAAGRATLEQLAATVRAAERMPGTRRKAAHRAVSGELDQLETQLLHRLGI